METHEYTSHDEVTFSHVFIDNWDACRSRVKIAADSLFDPSVFQLRLIRINEHKSTVTCIQRESDLEESLVKTRDEPFRIISFFQQHSLDPLQCSQEAMMRVIDSWGMSTIFFDVLLKFGYRPQVFEESSGFRQSYQEPDGSFELSYQLMYIEPSGRPNGRNPWSFRQTGTYHRYTHSTRNQKIVLLHPKNDPQLQLRLERHTNSHEKHDLAGHPMTTHLVVMSAYLLNWQDYIESFAETLDDIRIHITVADPTSSQITARELQRLKNVEDKIVCRAQKCLLSTRTILRTLISLNASLPKTDTKFAAQSASIHQQFQLLDQRLEGHVSSTEVLAQRISATLGLLTNVLDLQNHGTSGRISSRMLTLTRKNVDDSATVRVVTICTLIYLPASFVASFFGMNFFDFQSGLGRLTTSSGIWLYIAATLPLTLLTVGAWWWYQARYQRARKADEEKAE